MTAPVNVHCEVWCDV